MQRRSLYLTIILVVIAAAMGTIAAVLQALEVKSRWAVWLAIAAAALASLGRVCRSG